MKPTKCKTIVLAIIMAFSMVMTATAATHPPHDQGLRGQFISTEYVAYVGKCSLTPGVTCTVTVKFNKYNAHCSHCQALNGTRTVQVEEHSACGRLNINW